MWPRQFDENHNNCPQFYQHLLQNPRSPVEQYFGPILREGFRHIDISSYLESIDNLRLEHQCHTLQILMNVYNRSSLTENHPPTDHEIVFVWDINEITMMSAECLEEVRIVSEEMRPHVDAMLLLMTRVLLNSKFDLDSDLEEGDVMNIEDVFKGQTDELKSVQDKYQALKLFYDGVLKNDKTKSASFSHDLLEKCDVTMYEKYFDRSARFHQKIFHNRWKYAKKCLKLVNKRSATNSNKYANVVITEGRFGLAAAQLVVSGHSEHVPIENIYSTFNSSEAEVLDRIQQRFGAKCVLVQVSSRATNSNVSVGWQVHANQSIKYLYEFQRDKLLT